MLSTTREIGTLVAVILKAQHLPNKRNIGKQDPYCVVSVNGEKQRTKVIKRGGQHPEWDEELRFKLYEEEPVTANGPDGAPPPPPPKDGKKNIKGGSVMKLSCFADDPREPSLIGQADVDLTEVLTKGETDEWFTLLNKDKFAGKVYLELTFWSNEAPPEKKVAPVPQNNKEYAGPGSFVASDGVSDYRHPSSRVVSIGDVYAHSRRQSDSGQSTIRPSTSLAQLDLYRPAYEVPEPHHRSRVASFSALTNDFAELGVDPHRRRESLPHGQSNVFHARPPSVSYHRATYPPPHGYEPSTSDATSMYQYDRPVTPPGPSRDPSTFVNTAPYAPPAPYRPQYEAGPVYNPPPSRGPRYSSGFMPISNSTSSGFVPLASHPSEPSGFNPPPPGPPSGYPPYPSQTPAPGYAAPLPPSASADFHPHPSEPSSFNPPPPAPPSGYPPSHINPSQTPAPGYAAPLRHSSSVDFHPQPGFPSSQSQYSQFQSQPPLQQYNPPPQTHMQTPTPPAQPGYVLSASPSNQSPGPSLSHSNSLSSSTGPGSRPLPPPPQFQAAQGHQSYGLPPGAGQPAHPGSYSPNPPGVSTFQENYHPPPPPRPVSLHETSPQPYPGDPQGNLAPPPPPALSPPQSTPSPRRRTSLPPTPNYAPLPVPPPPPPPLEYPPPPPPPLPSHIMPPHNQPYYPGPPPRPPTQIDGGQAQWGPPPLQNNYVQQSWS